MNEIDFRYGPIVLMGSGETAPASGAVFEQVARQYQRPIHIAILETPAGFELNSSRVAGRVGDFLKNRLQNYNPVIDIIPARKKGTDYSPDSAEILEPLYRADVIFMGPGSPTYAARQLSYSLAYEIIQARQRTGATIVLASAATIAFGCQTLPVYEIYKAGMDLHWQPGLNFFQPLGLDLIIVPHWNNTEGGAELDTSRCFMGTVRFNQLRELVNCDVNILGLDEHTSIWLDLEEGVGRVFGKGTVHLIAGKNEDEFQSGQSVALKKHGFLRTIPDQRTGVRQAVWDSLEKITTEVKPAASESIPEGVMDLVRQREAARKSANFLLADSLRQKIEESGWKVTDTTEGPLLNK